MSTKLTHIKGRATGACDGPGRPKFTGTISSDGRIRIDCDNYPEHWQEIQLPERWVEAYKAYNERSRGSRDETLEDNTKVQCCSSIACCTHVTDNSLSCSREQRLIRHQMSRLTSSVQAFWRVSKQALKRASGTLLMK